MLPTCVVNFRCIVGVEHFQKILVLKKSPKHCQYFFNFLINPILILILNFNTNII
jgi:fumarate reductase subunit C